jgi:hypothetical protein
LALLTNCGANKVSKTDGASRTAGDTTFDDFDPSASNVYSNCNAIPSNNLGFSGPVSSFFDPQAQAYVDDLIRMKFNTKPQELIDSTTHYVEIYKWKENKQYDQSGPVQIYFQLKHDGSWISEPVTNLSRATIQSVIVDNNLSAQGYNLDNFFGNVILTLAGMDLQWDAVSIFYYDDSAGDEPIGTIDVLLPAFDANPNEYAKTHPLTALQQLHPMWQYRNSNYDNEDYYYYTNGLCAGF